MHLPEIKISFPVWVKSFLDGQPDIFQTRVERMRLAIELSRLNVHHATGGPFGAALFDGDGRLVSPGINMVVSSGCSLLHAETVALAFAQKVLGRYDLGAGGTLQHELYASTEPCAMCFGAIPWSGVTALFCAARSEDARAIGFDEGDKPADWTASLEKRGISVEQDLLRADAVAVLQDYASSGGELYNPG
jgi:tRNA(Arg) A34 adenosine deaminase TadA